MSEKIKKTKNLQTEEKYETIAYVLVKDSNGLKLQVAKFAEQPEIVEEVDLKNGLSESTYFLTRYFVNLLRKMF